MKVIQYATSCPRRFFNTNANTGARINVTASSSACAVIGFIADRTVIGEYGGEYGRIPVGSLLSIFYASSMINLFLLTLVVSSKYWSVTTDNGEGFISALNVNSHHTEHVVYGFKKDGTMFAIVTFKNRKRVGQVYNLYSEVDIDAEPQPNSNRLRDNTKKGMIRTNVNFMRSNFRNTSEIM